MGQKLALPFCIALAIMTVSCRPNDKAAQPPSAPASKHQIEVADTQTGQKGTEAGAEVVSTEIGDPTTADGKARLQAFLTRHYDPEEFRSALPSDSLPYIAILENRKTLLDEKIVFVDDQMQRITREIDLLDSSPFISYMRYGKMERFSGMEHGYNSLLYDAKEDRPLRLHELRKRLPKPLHACLENGYQPNALFIGNDVWIQDESFLIVMHHLWLTPAEEMLEFVTIPGLSAVDVYDRSGNSMGRFQSLPFKTDQIIIHPIWKRALVVHHQAVTDPMFNTTSWQHGLSIYAMNSDRPCYYASTVGQYDAQLDRSSGFAIVTSELELPASDPETPNREIHTHVYVMQNELHHYIFTDRQLEDLQRLRYSDLGMTLDYSSGQSDTLYFAEDWQSVEFECPN